MTGWRQVAQGVLFCESSLQDHVPQDHLIRVTDRFVDLGGIRRHLAPFYSTTGGPPVDPELMIRMVPIGYCCGIRSERRICDEVHLTLAHRSFCRLDLTTAGPDHSTFSRNRQGRLRYSKLLREVFERVVHRCRAEGLIGGSDFASAAGLIRADAPKIHSRPPAQRDDGQIAEEAAPRAVREYPETRDDAAFGAATDARPTFIACRDPASQGAAAMNGPAIFACSVNYLIDTDKAVIVDVGASRSIRQAEVGATRTMLDRTKDPFDLQPERLAADRAYGSGDMLGWLDDRQITPLVPVAGKTDRTDGTFPNTAFRVDPEADEYPCPGGNTLKKCWRTMSRPRTGTGTGADGFRKYYAGKKDFGACALKTKCTPNREIRKVSRHPYEAVRDKVRAMAGTDAFLESRRRRRRSKCCSPISSASGALRASDCAARTERKTKSTSPQQRRTSANSQTRSQLGPTWREADARVSETENWARQPGRVLRQSAENRLSSAPLLLSRKLFPPKQLPLYGRACGNLWKLPLPPSTNWISG